MYIRLHWKVTEDVHEQIDDQQHLANILPPPSVVSSLQHKEGNKLLLEQLVLGELILQKKCISTHYVAKKIPLPQHVCKKIGRWTLNTLTIQVFMQMSTGKSLYQPVKP